MGEHRVTTIRILGITAAARGFACAALENGVRLVDWGGHRMASSEKTVEIIDGILCRTRPLFVAVEDLRTSRKRARGLILNQAVVEACARHSIMVLNIMPHEFATLVERRKPRRQEIAERVARWFPEIARRLPRRRAPWEGEDNRLGLFIAVATALATWRRFYRRR